MIIFLDNILKFENKLVSLPQKIINNEMARQKRTTNRFLADSSELKMIRRTAPVITGNITISADVIKAGSNVTDTKPQGPVYFNGGVINLNGGTVELNGETTVTIGTTLNINSN